MFTAEHVTYRYKKKTDNVVSDVSFEMEEGYFTCLLGHNGAGKTTLLKLLYGMLIPDSGTIRYDGADVTKAGNEMRLELAYIGTGQWCMPQWKVEDSIRFLGALYETFDRQLFEEQLGERNQCDRRVVDSIIYGASVFDRNISADDSAAHSLFCGKRTLDGFSDASGIR